MLEPSIYSISEGLKGALETTDTGGLDKRRLRVVPDVHGGPGSHGVLGRAPGVPEVAALQGNLRYVRVVEAVPDLPEDPRAAALKSMCTLAENL